MRVLCTWEVRLGLFSWGHTGLGFMIRVQEFRAAVWRGLKCLRVQKKVWWDVNRISVYAVTTD